MTAIPELSMSGTLPLKKITGTTPPRERMANPSDGRALVSTLLDANKKRAEFYALCEGQLDGNPPYDPGTLRSHGQQWRTNVNPMDAEAMAESGMTPYYDLFAGGKYYVEVTLDEPDPDKRWQYSGIVTEKFHDMLKRWRSFRDEMYAVLFDRMYHGKGFPMFPDDDDWRFEYVPQHRVLVPDATEADPDRAEAIVVLQRLTVTRLWKFIMDKATASDRGWNVEACARAMRAAQPDQVTGGTNVADNYVEAQNWLRDRDISESARSDKVEIAHIFVAEHDGPVSHYIVTQTDIPGEPKGGEWLFRKVRAYDSMRQVIAPMFYETRRHSWNGSSGMAKRTFSAMELNTRVFNSLMDGTFLRAGITIQAKSQRSRQSTALVQVGAFNIIPPEYDVQQSTVMGDIEGCLLASRYLEEKVSSNTGTFRQRLEKPQGNPRTAEEVRLQYQSAAILGNSAVNRFYDDVDPLYAEMFRRASDPKTTDADAKEFQAACTEAGVPKSLLRKNPDVRAYRQMGNGSVFLRQQAIASSLPLVPLMNEAGRVNWLDDAISVTASHATVQRWNPRATVPNTMQRDAWDANVEDNNMARGGNALATSTQNHVLHAQTHMASAAQAVQSVQQGGDPVQATAFAASALEHVASHLQAISTDKYRKDTLNALMGEYKQLSQVVGAFQEQIQQAAQQNAEAQQKMAQAQAIAQGTDPDTAIKAAEAQRKMQLQTAKTQHAMSLKSAKAQQDMAIADLKTAQQVRASQ